MIKTKKKIHKKMKKILNCKKKIYLNLKITFVQSPSCLLSCKVFNKPKRNLQAL